MPADTKKNSLQLYARLQTYALRYKAWFALSILGFCLFAVAQAAFVKIIEFFIAELNTQKENTVLAFLPGELTSSLFFVPVAVVISALIYGMGSFIGNYFMGKLGLGVVNNLRKDVFNQMVVLPQAFYDKNNSGELLSIIIYNIEQVTGSVTNASKIFFRDGFAFIAFFALLIYYSWKLTLIFFVIAPVLALLVFFAARYFRKTSTRIQRTVGRITHIATETFQGIKLVKSYGGEKYERSRFARAADESLDYGTRFERVSALQTPILHFVISLALAAIFLLILLFWEGTAEAAVMYVTTAGFLTKPFRQLSNLNAVIQKGMAASRTIFEIIDLPEEDNSGKLKLDQVKGEVVFDNVGFSYDEQQIAVQNISFTIKPGETLALVGGSGSGKTTIANLLLRFYNKQSGSITIDGNEISLFDLDNLREQIALVNQQTILFNDSVKANIAYGKENYDQDRIEEVAVAANAHGFITELPQGYNTVVGEDGALLSGGQRQRIAIARALYKNAPILILDEATSALDNESEKQIQEALERLKQNRATLVIAHRLSTIENADTILVLHEGNIVEVGTHQTLMDKAGYYANLYKGALSQEQSTQEKGAQETMQEDNNN